jgi:SAM-dependent methyltransferase
MQTEDYEYLYRLEERFWWFAGMRTIATAVLDEFCAPNPQRVILDAGCGTGGNLEWLRCYGAAGQIFGIDVSADALQFCRQRGHDLLARASVTELPFGDSLFDLVTSFDVLGQLPNEGADAQAVREMYRVLRPGGVAFVRVAAYEWLRSGHDEALATQKRYHLPALSDLLKCNGFSVLRATYANTFLLPVAAFRRLVLKRAGLADGGSDVKPLAPWLQPVNSILRGVLHAEASWLKTSRFDLPAGVSAICVVRKPDS